MQKLPQLPEIPTVWYNLTRCSIALPDGEILEPKGLAKSEINYADGETVMGLPTRVPNGHKLTLNGLPFPQYDHGIRYLVEREVVINHSNRADIFFAVVDNNLKLTGFTTTGASNDVLEKRNQRAQKR